MVSWAKQFRLVSWQGILLFCLLAGFVLNSAGCSCLKKITGDDDGKDDGQTQPGGQPRIELLNDVYVLDPDTDLPIDIEVVEKTIDSMPAATHSCASIIGSPFKIAALDVPARVCMVMSGVSDPASLVLTVSIDRDNEAQLKQIVMQDQLDISVVDYDHQVCFTTPYSTATYAIGVVAPGFCLVANAGADRTVLEAETVALSAVNSHHSEAAELTYAWNQVGGLTVDLTGTATEAASWTPPNIATTQDFAFELTASDEMGNIDTDLVTISVTAYNEPPVAVASAVARVPSTGIVTLDGSGSYDAESQPLQFTWLQTGGPFVSLSDEEVAQPTFSADTCQGCPLEFQLVVNDGLVDSLPVTVSLAVNMAPVAEARDLEDDPTTLVTLNGGRSHDGDGDPLTYSWNQVAGDPVVLSNSTVASPTFTTPAASPQTLLFELTVDDGYETSAVETVEVYVKSGGTDFCTAQGAAPNWNSLGSGTALDPHRICNVGQLNDIGANGCNASTPTACDKDFRLHTDLDLGGGALNMIGSDGNRFVGVFDGNSHTINDFTINGADRVGIIRAIGTGGTVKNLVITNGAVTGSSFFIGGIAGISYGTISQVSFSGTVTGNDSNTYVGGLAGISRGLIAGSFFSGTVSTTGTVNYVGGISGDVTAVTLIDCYSEGTVNIGGVTIWVGGVAGALVGGSLTKRVYTSANVIGGSAPGAFAGSAIFATFQGSFWDSDTSGVGQAFNFDIDNSGTAEGRSTAAMQQQATFTTGGANWDFTDTWTINEGVDYPRLRWESIP